MPAKRDYQVMRVGVFMDKAVYPRLQHITKTFDVSQGILLELLLLGMTDEEIRAAIERGRQKRGESHAKVKDLRKRLYNLTPEEMERALELLGKTGEDAAEEKMDGSDVPNGPRRPGRPRKEHSLDQ